MPKYSYRHAERIENQLGKRKKVFSKYDKNRHLQILTYPYIRLKINTLIAFCYKKHLSVFWRYRIHTFEPIY